jgi:hypothetical protein
MTDTQQILHKLDQIKTITEINSLDYLTTEQAQMLMGISNPRYLKWLCDKGDLFRYPRQGEKFVYKRSECVKCAEMIDSKTIVLPSKLY